MFIIIYIISIHRIHACVCVLRLYMIFIILRPSGRVVQVRVFVGPDREIYRSIYLTRLRIVRFECDDLIPSRRTHRSMVVEKIIIFFAHLAAATCYNVITIMRYDIILLLYTFRSQRLCSRDGFNAKSSDDTYNVIIVTIVLKCKNESGILTTTTGFYTARARAISRCNFEKRKFLRRRNTDFRFSSRFR